MTTHARKTDCETLHEVLKSFHSVMLLTHRHGASGATNGESGESLRGRPMAVARVDENETVWLVTAEESAKVDDVQHDGRVYLVAQNMTKHVVLDGIATIVRDRGKVEELWQESWKVWFPKGKSDPSIVFISVAMNRAEYWDMGGVKFLNYVWEAAKAYVTGHRPNRRELEEQHGIISRVA